MTFLNPAGLWILLGVPVLIIVYLLRRQHEDRTVSSTYIWKLSDRFLKKRFPLRLQGILLLLLQIAAVVMAAALVSRPMITHMPNTDYIVIVDCSASMMTADEDGVTRFEKAKAEAMDLGKKINSGHRRSVIAASDEPVCALRMTTSFDEAQLALEAMRCTYGGCDLEKAFSLANGISSETAHPQVVLLTDRACAETGSENVTVVDLSDEKTQKNLSVVSLEAREAKSGVVFTAKIASVGYEGTATVGLRIDGELIDASQIECASGKTVDAVFEEKPVRYQRAEVFIEIEDGRSEDNSFTLCRKVTRSRKVQIVSSSPFYLERALSTVDGCSVKIVSSLDSAASTGFDLYIYDGFSPNALPKDGAVLVFNGAVPSLGVSVTEARITEAIGTSSIRWWASIRRLTATPYGARF